MILALASGARELLPGYVAVELIVDVEGHVKQLTFKKPQSAELEKAVRAWKFKPAMLDGKAVEARLIYISALYPRTEKEAEAYRW
ncbi:MAG TPA: energy transducer TonB [Thermoanaerobaculia bacterium]|nr:energy transducer TonB [Thermoanaerobaculia bacterium]